MTLAAVHASTELTPLTCGSCSGTYALAERYRAHKEQIGGGWHCPYCQTSWGYFDNNENRLLKRQLHEKDEQLKREQKRTEWAKNEAAISERRRAALKGQVTKIKNRVGNGVCPCCNRTFANLGRHMTHQHPAWTPEKETS